MAVQTGIVTLKGKLANKVFSKRNGKEFGRIAPNSSNYRLSEGSKKSSQDFGVASSATALIKKGFHPIMMPLSDAMLISRLRRKMIAVINAAPAPLQGRRKMTDGDFALLKDLEFNSYTSVRKLFNISPAIKFNLEEDVLNLILPHFPIAESIHPPSLAEVAVIQFMCCTFDFTNRNGRFARAEDLLIPIKKATFPGGCLQLPLEDLEEKALIIAMGVSFLDSSGRPNGNRKWYAGNIVESVVIRNGSIVSFQYPDQKVTPASEGIPEKRISWLMNDEEE